MIFEYKPYEKSHIVDQLLKKLDRQEEEDNGYCRLWDDYHALLSNVKVELFCDYFRRRIIVSERNMKNIIQCLNGLLVNDAEVQLTIRRLAPLFLRSDHLVFFVKWKGLELCTIIVASTIDVIDSHNRIEALKTCCDIMIQSLKRYGHPREDCYDADFSLWNVIGAADAFTDMALVETRRSLFVKTLHVLRLLVVLNESNVNVIFQKHRMKQILRKVDVNKSCDGVVEEGFAFLLAVARNKNSLPKLFRMNVSSMVEGVLQSKRWKRKIRIYGRHVIKIMFAYEKVTGISGPDIGYCIINRIGELENL